MRRVSLVLLLTALSISLISCGSKDVTEANVDIEDLQKRIEALEKENENLKKQQNKAIADEDIIEKTIDEGLREQETWSDDTVITFTDIQLQQDIRNLIGYKDENITYGMVKDIRTFGREYESNPDYQAYVYSDITSLKYLTGLEELSGIVVHGSDISGLTNLKNLKKLCMDCDDVKDLSALEGLQELEVLDISCGATDISPLEKLQNLKDLTITCDTSDISPIGEIKTIESLMLHCYTSDYTPLSALQNLKTLMVYTPGCPETLCFSDLANVQSFILDDVCEYNGGNSCKLKTLIFENDNNLEDLKIMSFSNLTSICFKDNVNKLKTMDIYECNNVSELNFGDNTQNMESLSIRQNDVITNLEFLKGFTNLKDLYIENSNLKDISAIGFLTHLNNLKISENEVLPRIDSVEDFNRYYNNPETDTSDTTASGSAEKSGTGDYTDSTVIFTAPDGYVNFRQGPGKKYDIIASYDNGTEMYVIKTSENGKWLYGEINGQEGWIAKSQVSIQ